MDNITDNIYLRLKSSIKNIVIIILLILLTMFLKDHMRRRKMFSIIQSITLTVSGPYKENYKNRNDKVVSSICPGKYVQTITVFFNDFNQ